jgi:hypothetical protein
MVNTTRNSPEDFHTARNSPARKGPFTSLPLDDENHLSQRIRDALETLQRDAPDAPWIQIPSSGRPSSSLARYNIPSNSPSSARNPETFSPPTNVARNNRIPSSGRPSSSLARYNIPSNSPSSARNPETFSPPTNVARNNRIPPRKETPDEGFLGKRQTKKVNTPKTRPSSFKREDTVDAVINDLRQRGFLGKRQTKKVNTPKYRPPEQTVMQKITGFFGTTQEPRKTSPRKTRKSTINRCSKGHRRERLPGQCVSKSTYKRLERCSKGHRRERLPGKCV